MLQLVDERYVVREIDHDEILIETLTEWFSRRPSLRDVMVSATDGIVTLRGSVASNRDRALAIQLAWDAGADDVYDDLMLTWPLAA
ncbi:MAG TPA: BON domain-containing protein [Nitrospira sp.]|nr:BON domain-containing protein [Nitrospira sp.]